VDERSVPADCGRQHGASREECRMSLRFVLLWVVAAFFVCLPAPFTSTLGARQAGAASAPQAGGGPMKEPFGKTKDGRPIDRYTMKNARGMEADVITWGAIVTRLIVPDRAGKSGDVALGFDTLDGYLGTHPYFGAIVGRYGNRIAKGRFTLNGKTYTLAVNNGPNSLHGGLKGFDKQVWTARPVSAADGQAVELTYVSKDGEEGYPGALTAKVTYTLTNDNALRIQYDLTTDADTVANVTNHSYFNLAGEGTGDILSHEITIDADQFTPVDATLIPTGELRPVAGTPFDFRKPMAIGARINGDDEQIKYGKGYDHNFVLNGQPDTLRHAVRVSEKTSGRVMDVSTTEPGVQFYTGNFLDGTIKGKGGKVYNFRYGLCLETQHFPNSPNTPSFPSTVIKPGEPYRSQTEYRFSAAK
jgi:aldose 1-epimerase